MRLCKGYYGSKTYLMLAAFVLHGHSDAGWYMRQTYSRFCFVDMLQ